MGSARPGSTPGTANEPLLHLVDARGHTHNILEIGPRGLMALLRRDWKDKTASQAATKVEGMGEGDRLDYQHLKTLLAEKNLDLTPQEKEIAKNFATNGIWTRERADQAGYEIQEGTSCPKCGKAKDTLDHRLFDCEDEEVVAIRSKYLPFWAARWLSGKWSVLQGRRPEPLHKNREDSARLLARQGLARDPGKGQPGPATDGDDGEGDTALGFQQGFAFTDGGCRKLFHPSLDRASWPAVATDETGGILGAAWGPIWAGLPQTAPAGELMGLGIAAQLTPSSRTQMDIGIDNMMAVRLVN